MSRTGSEVFSDKLTKTKRNKRANHVDIWMKIILDRGNSKCKDSEVKSFQHGGVAEQLEKSEYI